METKTKGFRSWRDASPTIKLTWKEPEGLNNLLPLLIRQYPNLKHKVHKNDRMVTIKELSPAQVFFIKEWAARCDASAREMK